MFVFVCNGQHPADSTFLTLKPLVGYVTLTTDIYTCTVFCMNIRFREIIMIFYL
jgi:hypothetical protein